MESKPHVPYISGPWMKLATEEKELTLLLYTHLADACLNVFRRRGFAPHEHFSGYVLAGQIEKMDDERRDQIMYYTNYLVVVPIWRTATSMGGDIELAYQCNVPVIVLAPVGQNVSDMLLSHRATRKQEPIRYDGIIDARVKLENALSLAQRTKLAHASIIAG